jgi:hypothetical protein
MNKITSYKSDYAVSEIIGGLMLIIIAVLSFVTINLYAFPELDSPDEIIDVIGYVNENGKVVFEHVGGKSISSYKVEAFEIDGTFIDLKEYRDLENDWSIGKCVYPIEDINIPPLLNDTDKIEIILYIYNDNGEQEVFRGVLTGRNNTPPGDIPILISSLKTNSPDEDLICLSYPIKPNVNATTYIYSWKLNGFPFAELVMPFNTADNFTTKDYSGNGYDGTNNGANWISQGKIGGAYEFDGSSEYLSLDLPTVFNDIPNNDFTISLWITSDDNIADNSIALMGSKNTQNFIKLFQYGGEMHFGVCSDGIKQAVRSENILNDTWYHIAGVWTASTNELLMYVNGNEYDETGYRQFALGAGAGLLELGHGSASSKFWNGIIDELEIYDRALTKEQIYQIYLATRDGSYEQRVIISSLTTNGDSWQCIVTPNDGNIDDTPVESNIIRISNYSGGD